ncbi:MAG: O-antigen ligase family protein [Kiritimatiellae bacterium]|nr:O-antigen ligase family protein [Kiritimatiellia bacterium]
MIFFSKLLAQAGCVFLCISVLVGPWLFGAWEMWWFWPLTTCIFFSILFLAVRIIFKPDVDDYEHEPHYDRKKVIFCILAFIPFLVYALVRALQAEVFMDAERSFLLFFTSFLVGIQVLLGLNRKQLHLVYVLILINLACLGSYGLINHFYHNNTMVMWLPGYPQYIREVRATGSYFCPDHFAGIMELTLCLCLGVILDRNIKKFWKVLAIGLAILAVSGVVLSRSRGGGATVLVIFVAALVWGFSQWETKARWLFRIGATAILLLSLVVFCVSGQAYVKRFTQWFGWEQAKGKPFVEMKAEVMLRATESSRGRMFAGAYRAWDSSRAFGIGPGMHQNLWPHFSASRDGDREFGVWPSQPNHGFWSDFVHSDWLQLLEEYGMVGLALFLIPAGVVFWLLLAGREIHFATSLGGVLAFVCMAFHSIGDFNLQMPATAWVFAAILAIPLAITLESRYVLNPNEYE